jgi:hypothetical protein
VSEAFPEESPRTVVNINKIRITALNLVFFNFFTPRAYV